METEPLKGRKSHPLLQSPGVLSAAPCLDYWQLLLKMLQLIRLVSFQNILWNTFIDGLCHRVFKSSTVSHSGDLFMVLASQSLTVIFLVCLCNFFFNHMDLGLLPWP